MLDGIKVLLIEDEIRPCASAAGTSRQLAGFLVESRSESAERAIAHIKPGMAAIVERR